MKKPRRKAKRMGRPPLGDKARAERIIIRITRREKAAWTKAAKVEGMGLGPWLLKGHRRRLEGDHDG